MRQPGGCRICSIVINSYLTSDNFTILFYRRLDCNKFLIEFILRTGLTVVVTLDVIGI